MRITVTGGTGFIGSHLVRSLKEGGHEVNCLERGKNDIADADMDLRGADAVFHLAGLLGKHGIQEEEYWRVNFEGTKNILGLARKAGVKKFVHVSTGGAADPRTIYEKSKAKAEEEVLKNKEEINVTVVRPEFVYGPGDKHVLGLFKAARKPFPLFNGGRSRLHPTYIDDVVAILLDSLERPDSGEVIMAAGERIVTVRELAELMARAQGKKLRPVYVPKKLALAGAAVSELLFDNPPITRSMVNFFSEDRVGRQADENVQRMPLEEGLRRTAEWYGKKGLL